MHESYLDLENVCTSASVQARLLLRISGEFSNGSVGPPQR